MSCENDDIHGVAPCGCCKEPEEWLCECCAHHHHRTDDAPCQWSPTVRHYRAAREALAVALADAAAVRGQLADTLRDLGESDAAVARLEDLTDMLAHERAAFRDEAEGLRAEVERLKAPRVPPSEGYMSCSFLQKDGPESCFDCPQGDPETCDGNRGAPQPCPSCGGTGKRGAK